jgi:hypothetical protein
VGPGLNRVAVPKDELLNLRLHVDFLGGGSGMLSPAAAVRPLSQPGEYVYV